ncbi:MAG: GGDEF domain-containing protein [Gemmataceae bacterium]|nr:GGDEF domain-containing protein [Gemmataceae bacterium]
MSGPKELLDKTLLENALSWFQAEFQRQLVSSIQSHFPNYLLPRDIQTVLQSTAATSQDLGAWPGTPLTTAQVGENLSKGAADRLPLFKQIILRYRRHRAADTESKTEKTFHLELTETLEQEVKALDALVNDEWFDKVETLRLPRLKDFLPVQFIEAAAVNQIALWPRQYDEKFHILQAPNLFLPDLAYFRAKCEDRGTRLALAFLDIDHFKQFNTDHTETKVDRNLLPRFMQTVEAHVFHHGYAYRQGGDEYLILIPSLSKALSVAFLDELRCKLADLEYPDIKGRTTVSIGLCIVEPDCPLTDRELRDRASQAKQFAKDRGRNCVATYTGPRFSLSELGVVSPQAP